MKRLLTILFFLPLFVSAQFSFGQEALKFKRWSWGNPISRVTLDSTQLAESIKVLKNTSVVEVLHIYTGQDTRPRKKINLKNK